MDDWYSELNMTLGIYSIIKSKAYTINYIMLLVLRNCISFLAYILKKCSEPYSMVIVVVYDATASM